MPSIAIETNLIRKAFIDVSRSRGNSSLDPVDQVDFLGAAQASAGIRLLDLEILGWLTSGMLAGDETIRFEKRDLAFALYGRPAGGVEYRTIDDSLLRLSTTELTFGGYNADRKVLLRPVAFHNVKLLGDLRPWGSRHGKRGAWVAEPQPWLIRQLELGYVTYVDWNTLRSLNGLAKRLWLYAEAENFPKRRDRRSESERHSFVLLSRKGLATLGLNRYRSPGQALSALRRAASLVESADPRYRFTVDAATHGPRLNIFRLSVAAELPPVLRYQQLRAPEMQLMTENPLVGSKSARPVGGPGAPLETEGATETAQGFEDDPARAIQDDQTWAVEGSLEPSTHPSDFDFEFDLDSLQHSGTATHQRFVLIKRDGDPASLHRTGCPELEWDLIGLRSTPLGGSFVLTKSVAAAWSWCDEQHLRRPVVCSECARTPIG